MDRYKKAADVSAEIERLQARQTHLLTELRHSYAIQGLWPDVFSVCKRGGKVTSGIRTKGDAITCLKVHQWNEAGHHVETRTFKACEVDPDVLETYRKGKL